MALRPEDDQGWPNERARGEIERLRRGMAVCGYSRFELLKVLYAGQVDDLHMDLGIDRSGGEDRRDWLAFDGGEDGSERLVPADDFDEGGAQDIDLERTLD